VFGITFQELYWLAFLESINSLNNTIMIIDFNNMSFEDFPNFKGGEKQLTAKMFFDGTNRIMSAYLVPGASIGLHTHDVNSEILFVLKGEGTLLDDGISTPIKAGQCAYCPKGHNHSLINTSTENLEFVACVPNQ